MGKIDDGDMRKTFASISKEKGLLRKWFNFRGNSGMMTCNILESELKCWEEIVRLVNAHEKLLEACRRVKDLRPSSREDKWSFALVAVHEAIAQAEGKAEKE